jgi:hypothetical protein
LIALFPFPVLGDVNFELGELRDDDLDHLLLAGVTVSAETFANGGGSNLNVSGFSQPSRFCLHAS